MGKTGTGKSATGTASSRSQHLSPGWVPGPWRLAVRVGQLGRQRGGGYWHTRYVLRQGPLTSVPRGRGATCFLPQAPTCCSWWHNWADSPRRTSRLFIGVKEIFGEVPWSTQLLSSPARKTSREALRDYIQGLRQQSPKRAGGSVWGASVPLTTVLQGASGMTKWRSSWTWLRAWGQWKEDHYTNRLYSLLTQSDCGPVQSEERLQDVKRSLVKYMEIQRRGTIMAKANCLRKALIQAVLCMVWCAQVSAVLLIRFCVLHRTCDFFCRLPF